MSAFYTMNLHLRPRTNKRLILFLNSDIDAQIKRCEERIEDGILTWIFEDRLIGLKAEAEARK